MLFPLLKFLLPNVLSTENKIEVIELDDVEPVSEEKSMPGRSSQANHHTMGSLIEVLQRCEASSHLCNTIISILLTPAAPPVQKAKALPKLEKIPDRKEVTTSSDEKPVTPREDQSTEPFKTPKPRQSRAKPAESKAPPPSPARKLEVKYEEELRLLLAQANSADAR